MIKNTWPEPSMRIALSKNDDHDNDYTNATAPESPSRLRDPATSLTNSFTQSRLSPVPITIDSTISLPHPPPPQPPQPSVLHAQSYQSRPDHEQPPLKRPKLSDDEDEGLVGPATAPATTTSTIGLNPRSSNSRAEKGGGSYKLGNKKSKDDKDGRPRPGSNSPSIEQTTSSALSRPTRTSLRFRPLQTQTQPEAQPRLNQHPAFVPGPGNGLHDVDMQSGNNGGHDGHRLGSTRRGGAGGDGGGEINTGVGVGGSDGGERKIKVKDKSYINRQNVVGGEKRSLRSHDGGSRSKSELAMYFPNYEQVIALEPVKSEFLSADTTISVINDLTEPVQLDQSLYQPYEPSNPLVNLHNAQVIELSPLDSSTATGPGIQKQTQTQRPSDIDPLDDDHFFKPHRRLERQEKQLRNIEKERAQHEKGQLEHLLDELKGHDWLRVMGISGVTDSDKKLYLPKRDYFIGEVTSLLGKFKSWKKAKGLRLWERGRMSAAKGGKTGDEESGEEEGEEDEGEEEEEDEAEASGLRGDTSSKKHRRIEDTSAAAAVPDADDVDAWAARQLHQEALSASQNDRLHLHPSSHQTIHPSSPSRPPPPKQQALLTDLWANKPFTSFYSKPHLRHAALKRDKRSRTRMAFGEPVPELAQAEFRLPGDILTEEAIRAAQRRNRRLRREVGKKG